MSGHLQARVDRDRAGHLLHAAYRVARLAGYPAGGPEMAALDNAEQRYQAAAAAYGATLPPPPSPPYASAAPGERAAAAEANL